MRNISAQVIKIALAGVVLLFAIGVPLHVYSGNESESVLNGDTAQSGPSATDSSDTGGGISDTSNDNPDTGDDISDTSNGNSDTGDDISDTSNGNSDTGGDISDISNGNSDTGSVISDTRNDNSDAGISDPVIVGFLAAVLVALLSVCVNIILLKWRRLVGPETTSVIPNELILQSEKQMKAIKKVSATLNAVETEHSSQKKDLEKVVKFLSNLGTSVRSSAQSSENTVRLFHKDLIDSFSSLQNALAEKDQEIARLRGGYDTEVIRRFLIRFINLEKEYKEDRAELVENHADAEKMLKVFDDMVESLRRELKNCGLEEFTPKTGENITQAFGVDEYYETCDTQDPNRHHTIAEVLSSGWRLRLPDGNYACIKNARVVVYVKQEASTNG